MRRRDLLKAAPGAALSVTVGGHPPPRPPRVSVGVIDDHPLLRKAWRWDGRQWRRVRLAALRRGDRFKLEGVGGEWVARCDGRPSRSGVAAVEAVEAPARRA